jgi:hypothetical protein
MENYEKCWYCGQAGMTQWQGYWVCPKCGATWNPVPRLGDSVVAKESDGNRIIYRPTKSVTNKDRRARRSTRRR